MNRERLEQIYSDAVGDIPEEQLDFLHFVAFKANGLGEQEIKKYEIFSRKLIGNSEADLDGLKAFRFKEDKVTST